MADVGWLSCESVQPGMFSDELAVVVERIGGATEAHFVPAREVQTERNRVRVSFRESGHVVWATLPTSESATIPVRRSSVTAT